MPQKTVEYHDAWDAPAHKAVLRKYAKYGNDVALWPKDAAEEEYKSRQRWGKSRIKRGARSSGRTAKYTGTKKKSPRKRVASK
jgi:hypothetical protein